MTGCKESSQFSVLSQIKNCKSARLEKKYLSEKP